MATETLGGGGWRFLLLIVLAMLGRTTSSVASDLDTIGITRLRSADPTLVGTGVRVGLAESEAATNAWQVNPAAVGQPVSLFTYSSSAGSATTFPNSLGLESGHADAVGNLYFGNPDGVAPGVNHVDNYQADYFYTQIILSPIPSSIGAKIINQSFIFNDDPTLEQMVVDRNYDDYIAQFGTIVISGGGNVGPVSTPSTAYNGLCVGAFGGASSVGPTADNGRAKPDITAPAPFTSSSTPLVAGCAAILVQAGTRGDAGQGTASAATDSRTVKALLLNGAVKPPDWTRSGSSPLDFRYGAGVVNVFNAYQQLQGGQQPFTVATTSPAGGSHLPPSTAASVAVLRGWDLNSITSSLINDAVNHYFFQLNGPTNQVFTCTATLVWHRPKSSPVVSSINNLDLFLFNAADNSLVANSQSQVDNVEHLFVKNLPPGRYDLQVLKNGGLSTPQASNAETYALAFEFASPVTPRFVDATVANEQFRARLLGEPNQSYVIQTSADFVNWTGIITNMTMAQGFFDFTNAASAINVFYRAQSQ